ncbi:MAG: magnesium transporter [Chthoniobacteraceae bacterium]
MIGHLLGPEIQSLIEMRNFAALREVLVDFSPADVAEIVNDLPEQDRAIVFRLLPHTQAADVFEYLDPDAQTALLKAMGAGDAARILNEMSPDDRTALLEELPGTAVAQMLQLLSPEEKKIAQSLLNYPEGSVGRLMTPDFIKVGPQWTVRQALDFIRDHGNDSETLNVIYVTDDRGRLIDDVRIREFLLRPLDTIVDDIHDSSFVALHATDPQSEALELFKKYDRNTLPVVDSDEKLLGIVTVDDMLDVQEEEATEDIQKLGGTEALDEPYMDTPIGELIKKRAPWLAVLFLGEMLTATVIGYFEHELQRAVVLALFIPLIVSSGGNSGSQASTLVIRAMALGEVTLRDWWRVLRREIASGLILGAILGVLGVVRVVVAGHFAPQTYGAHGVLIGVTLGVTVASVVLWGTLCGSMLPLILRRLGLDPATSSAPFVATLVDVTGLLIYFSAAMLILRGTVL